MALAFISTRSGKFSLTVLVDDKVQEFRGQFATRAAAKEFALKNFANVNLVSNTEFHRFLNRRWL